MLAFPGARSTVAPVTEADEAGRELLRRGLLELEVEREETGELAQRLWAFTLLLAEWTQRIRLSGHRTSDAIVRRLILDAVALAGALPELRTARTLVDLGSGPGLPGLPIAVLHPHCEVTLVESRERPHYFQREAVRRLGLQNVQPLRGRAEELEPRPADIVIAQAMARPERALERMLRWALPGGMLAIAAGAEPPHLPARSDISLEPARAYQVPLDGPHRSLWLARRTLE